MVAKQILDAFNGGMRSRLYTNGVLTDEAQERIRIILEVCSELRIPTKLFLKSQADELKHVRSVRLNMLTSPKSINRFKLWMNDRRKLMGRSSGSLNFADKSASEALYEQLESRWGQEAAFYLGASDYDDAFLADLIQRGKVDDAGLDYLSKLLDQDRRESIVAEMKKRNVQESM